MNNKSEGLSREQTEEHERLVEEARIARRTLNSDTMARRRERVASLRDNQDDLTLPERFELEALERTIIGNTALLDLPELYRASCGRRKA